MSDLFRNIRRFLFLRVLHANDPPHALALGFAIGLFVGMTPTIGVQMIIAAAVAAAFKANKLVSAATVWVSNPVTMFYIYFMNWRIGQYFVETSTVNDKPAVEQQITRIIESIGGISNLFFHLLDKAFWSGVLRLVWGLGVELWIGSFLVGAICALPGYFIARWGITVYRERVPRPRFFKRSRRVRRQGQPLPAARPRLRKPSAQS